MLMVTEMTEDGAAGNIPPNLLGLSRRPKYKWVQLAREEKEEDEEEEEEVRPWHSRLTQKENCAQLTPKIGLWCSFPYQGVAATLSLGCERGSSPSTMEGG